jgi:hypothetical protein
LVLTYFYWKYDSEQKSVKMPELAGTWAFDPIGYLLRLIPSRLAGSRKRQGSSTAESPGKFAKTRKGEI